MDESLNDARTAIESRHDRGNFHEIRTRANYMENIHWIRSDEFIAAEPRSENIRARA
jgi:hypothetical protein